MARRRGFVLAGTLVVVGTLVTGVVIATSSSHSRTVRVPTPAASLRVLEADLAAASSVRALPALAVPLSQLAQDVPFVSFDRGCLVSFNAASATGSRPRNCFFGDLGSSRTLVLYGDSNADMWLGAFDALGRKDLFRVDLVARASCQVPDLELWNPAAHAPGVACTKFRQWALEEIARVHPFVTVVSDYEYGRRWDYQHRDVPASVAAAALTRTLVAITHYSSLTVMLATPPALFVDPTQCLAVHSSNITTCDAPLACLQYAAQNTPACQFAPSTGRTWALVQKLPAAVRAAGAAYINVDRLFCSTTACPTVVDHLIVNYDLRHVAMHYSVFISRAMAELFANSGVALAPAP